MWLYIILGFVALLVVFLAVLVIRAIAFKPIKKEYGEFAQIEVDKEKAITDLQEMIRCKTISSLNKEEEDEGEFDKFKELLQTRFPLITKVTERQFFGSRGILYRWSGENHDKPVVLMAHFDVVSVEESRWQNPAFEGMILDGELWGRGAIDTKITLNGIMQAAEKLLSQGFVPKQDIYFSFSGDEEIAGTGTPQIVDYFEQRGIIPELVLDEGGALVQNVFPGVKKTSALIGIAEKGMMNVEFSLSGAGGHASSPPPRTAIGQLSEACVRIEKSPMKSRLSRASKGLFDTMGRNSTFVYRLIFSNLKVFKPILDMICKKSGGEMNALMRTTVAFTQMEGSKGANVLPASAKMIANLRLIEGDTVESVLQTLKKKIANDKIDIKIMLGNNPSPSSDMTDSGYGRVESAILGTWGDVIVSPYLMVACSDSRHYCRISKNVFRFSAMELTNEERALIHGNDERISIDKIVKCVEFYTRVISNC